MEEEQVPIIKLTVYANGTSYCRNNRSSEKNEDYPIEKWLGDLKEAGNKKPISDEFVKKGRCHLDRLLHEDDSYQRLKY